MSLHRRAAKRDSTEKSIVATLEAHECVVWPISGTGLTDLLVFHRKRTNTKTGESVRRTYVADCKSAKGKPTPAQVKRWTELTSLGFSVFILRTPEDAVAMLNDALRPWEPEVTGSIRAPRPHGDDKKPRRKCRGQCGKHGWDTNGSTKENDWRCSDCGAPPYTPPCSTPVDAPNEAEVFAPPDDGHKPCAHAGCRKRVLGSDTCMEHDP